MENQIQSEAYKRLYKALECKETELFLACIQSCALTRSELLLLQKGALKFGCAISLLAAIQNKINQTPVMTTDSNKYDAPKPRQKAVPPIKKHHSGSNKKIKIIAFKCDFLQYCIFDKTRLHLNKNIKIDTQLTCPGYLCPKCNSLYVNHKYLPSKEKKPIKGKKPKSNLHVRDINTIHPSLHPSKKKKVMSGFFTTPIKKDKNAFIPPVVKKKAVFVSLELPPVCRCKSRVFDYTQNFSLPNSSVTFPGKYCRECKEWFITIDTFNRLSSKTQDLINRRSVTWNTQPDIRMKKKKPIPKAPSSSPTPKPLFWWEKEIRTQEAAQLSEYPYLQGKGKQILQVSFGIDFGSSTTKVIVRTKLGDNKPTWRALVFGADFACEEDSDNTLAKSQIYISDTGRIGLGKEGVPGWKEKQYFKAVLVNANKPKHDLDEVYYAIFYISAILRTIQENVKNAYPPAVYSKIDLHITMGMPIRGEKEALVTVFSNILRIADELKALEELSHPEGVPFTRWKTLCQECCVPSKNTKPYLSVRPELYAEVIGLFTSASGPKHRALVIDVGSATLDIAFVYTQPPLQPYLYIPIAEVAPLGIEIAASRMKSYNPSVFTTLHQAREYLMTYPQTHMDDKVLHEVVQGLFSGCTPKIKKVENEVFDKALVQPIVPVYFYGGGRDAQWYKRKIIQILDPMKTGITFNQPSFQLEEIPRVPNNLLHRFQVALGLSNNGNEEKPLKSLPPDHDPFWKDDPFGDDDPSPKKRKWHVDLDELQKNLYGN